MLPINLFLCHSCRDLNAGKKSSPRQSPKANNFNRDLTRRSLDVYIPKGPDFDKVMRSSFAKKH